MLLRKLMLLGARGSAKTVVERILGMFKILSTISSIGGAREAVVMVVRHVQDERTRAYEKMTFQVRASILCTTHARAQPAWDVLTIVEETAVPRKRVLRLLKPFPTSY